jgi:hypothetical protein
MAVADFDHDGIDDLAVTETCGSIWIFETRSPAERRSAGVIVNGSATDGLDIMTTTMTTNRI